ncbi:hydroxymethylbilane synthase [Actinospongicola halichondriae]|uniref:hydroxymethylbilane synthase n=1 Tax=Actinospongicola halichondriae TaxID=3236844 RepID=UPI003D4FFC65
MKLRAATRQSPLALWQTEHVKALLEAAHPGLEVELVPMTSAPDTDLTKPISDIGGKGAFAKEVQQAVLDGRADFAVHSAKDLPSTTVPGLTLGAIPERGDARDVLVGCALVDLPVGSIVATGSNRRRTQLQDLRPDLRFVELRGNVQRRVAQVGMPAVGGQITAIIAAGAGLLRQDMERRISDWLPTYVMTPQVGQGALAIECRADDADTAEVVAAIEHAPSRREVDAERSFLVALGGDCDLPAGAHATLEDDGMIALRAVVASMDASRVARCVVRSTDPSAVGPLAIDKLPVTDLLH